MNLIWLDDFLTLAGSGSFSRAAQERHMTQPAFSRRVRALEDWLGVVLFDRSTQPATLTEAGEWFRAVAQELLTRVAGIPDQARAVADASSATLRIASTHALSFSFLPGWLRGLESRLVQGSGQGPGPVQLISDVMQQCEALMQQGRVQFLLCHAHEQVPSRLDPASHHWAVVGHDALLPVSAPDASGRPRHSLDGTGGKPVPLLEYSAESGIGRLVRALRGGALAEAHAQSALTAHLASVLKTMALDGRGVAWLPRSLIADDLAAGRLTAAGGAQWAIEVEIRLFRPRSPLPRAAERFWAVVDGPPMNMSESG
ncbi:LysR family transcriptional regulator [Rhizobacter sp. OV335]|uniref:LysR family transcriptional regulator n=1 Tax=Rhizobacter sp. OV335 TaxID=1500264 RepID=UPI00090FB1B0|nr:LysR family transcriptional regulator [Rhizobacter sp. OV335]SHN37432.1 DNA-binding transcriptional regulator, LysR family [Rhizobacter sp. OV335]